MPKKVYISSTYKDLRHYRDALYKMFRSKAYHDDFTAIGMEGYVSESGRKSLDVCLDDVRQADVYLLVLGKKYGSTYEDTGKSYTELEYQEAVEKEKNDPNFKIFVFYSSDESEEKDFEGFRDLENKSLRDFYKEALKNRPRFSDSFTNPDNLCLQIALAFRNTFFKSNSLSDYEDDLIYLDRKLHSSDFKKYYTDNQASAAYFSSHTENSPEDFVKRIHKKEIENGYKKCLVSMDNLTLYPEKFRENFNEEIVYGWGEEYCLLDDEYNFDEADKLFLVIGVDEKDFQCEKSIVCLKSLLLELLPKFLIQDDVRASNHLFVIYFTHSEENYDEDIFETFISELSTEMDAPFSMIPITKLKKITRRDTQYWFNDYANFKKMDDSKLDKILATKERGPFMVKDVKNGIRDYFDNKQ